MSPWAIVAMVICAVLIIAGVWVLVEEWRLRHGR